MYQISKLNWITMVKTVPKQRQKDPISLWVPSHDLLSRNCVVSEMRNYSCLPIPAAWMIAALRKRTSWQRINFQIFMENWAVIVTGDINELTALLYSKTSNGRLLFNTRLTGNQLREITMATKRNSQHTTNWPQSVSIYLYLYLPTCAK